MHFRFAARIDAAYAALARDAGAIARVRNDDVRDHRGVFVEASSWSAQARVAPRVWTADYSSITTTLRALRPGV